jgi:hypothetical protein
MKEASCERGSVVSGNAREGGAQSRIGAASGGARLAAAPMTIALERAT